MGGPVLVLAKPRAVRVAIGPVVEPPSNARVTAGRGTTV